MDKRKRGKKRADKNADEAKNRNSKVKKPKRKSKRVPPSRKPSAGKKKTSKPSRKPRSIKKPAKVRADSRLWAKRRDKRRDPKKLRASYSTLTLRHSLKHKTVGNKPGKKFKIRKKSKALTDRVVHDVTKRGIANEVARYIKLDKTSKKKTKKKIFIKIPYRHPDGTFSWVSAPRQTIQSYDEIESVVEAIFTNLRGLAYGNGEGLIAGYEIEEVI